MKMSQTETPKRGYRCALDRGERTVTTLYTVVDTSDNDTVIDTFRNRVIAERLAATSPAFAVRDYSLKMRD